MNLKIIKIIICVLGLLCKCSISSKLNVPRVLLPLFHDFTTNFTLEVKDSGCYKWSTLRPNIITLKQLYVDPELGCSSEVVISANTKEFHRNSETVLAEDVHSGQILRCEVILDVIHSLFIRTTTRELFLEESPESFEVGAYDDQGNAFSTLEGVEFEWTLKSIGHGDKNDNRTSEFPVLRYISFYDSPYETPPSVAYFDKLGMKGHIVLLEGVQTGIASVSVRLPYSEYKNVSPITVQLMVLTNLIISPPEISLLLGDQIKYRLFQVQHGKVNEIELPSKQYYLQSENPNCATVDVNTGVARGLIHCKTRIILVDRNVISSIGNDVKPATATIAISKPEEMILAIQPGKKWAVVAGKNYEIFVEIYDAEKRKIHIGDGVEVKTKVDEEFFRTDFGSPNGTYIYGAPRKKGQTKITSTLLGVVDHKGALKKTDTLSAQATLQIYNAIEVTPSAVLLPWDPVTKCKYEIPLTVTGGDGNFIWTSSNNSIAVVTQLGVVKTLEEGSVVISAVMERNHFNKGTSRFYITTPERLEILDYVMEADVGVPIEIFVALYVKMKGVEVPFTLCDILPFEVLLSEDNFEYVPGNSSQRIGSSCGSITLVGRSPGASRVTVRYDNLEATAVVAAHRKLVPFNPSSGTTILAVGTSRNIAFVGGPRPWVIRPSEHSHGLTVQNAELDPMIDYEEREDNTQSQHRDFYVYHVTCKRLGETTLNFQVSNKIPASNSKPTESTATITVICGKPRYILLIPVAKKADASRCPMHLSSERIISQNYRDIELEIVVNDIQGRKFDNISSLNIDWNLSHLSLARLLDTDVMKASTIKEENVDFPLRFYQVLRPKGRTGVLGVKARVPGYNRNFLEDLRIAPESPPFPERSKKGKLETPDIETSLSVILVNDTIVTPNLTEIYNHDESRVNIQVAQGSGFYDFVLNNPDVVNLTYSEETRLVELKPIDVGKVQISLVDLCLEAKPAVLEVKVYSIGSIKLDVPEKVENGKSVTAIVSLFNEEGVKLSTVPDVDLIHLKPLAESNIIKVKPYQDRGQTPGELRYLVSGVQLGDTYLKFSAGIDDQEIHSRSSQIQVFPGLKIYPKNVTMLVGSTLQVNPFDGPADGSTEYSVDKPSLAKVDNGGVIEALKIGKTTLVARSVSTHRDTGEKVVDSEDSIEINIVPLKGVTIQSPITRIVQGATMPLWAVGSPEDLDSMRLGATKYEILFFWEINHENYAQLKTVFDDMGVKVPENDQVTMRFKALKPGRVTVTLTVEVPSQISGTAFKKVFTDSLVVEIYPSLQLIKPKNTHLSSILLSTDVETQLRTNRDVVGSSRIQYFVTPLPEPGGSGDISGPTVAVTENGKIKTFSSYGRAAITMATVEDFGLRTWHSVAVNVKPVHYVMLNVDSKLKIKGSESVHVLPSGLDIDFYVTFHDNFGVQFDAVQSNILLESNQKGCLHFGTGETNSSVVVSVIDKGYSMLKIWDERTPHKPADFVKIHTGDVIFPVNSQITVGDVVCFRMPLTCGEDPVKAWAVSNPQLLRFYDEIAVGVACERLGTVSVSYQSKKKLTTTLDIAPIESIEFVSNDIMLTTVPDSEYHFNLVLRSATDKSDKFNNLISYNGTCNSGSENFKITCFPFNCEIRFNNAISAVDVSSIFSVEPDFNIKTGLYSCKVKVVSGPGKKISTLTESVSIRAETKDGSARSAPQLVPLMPGIYLHQSELKVTQIKPNDLLTVTGVNDVLVHVKVLPDYKNLVSITIEDETPTSRTYSIDVDNSWWAMEDPPQLSVLVWSKVTDQKVKVPIRCVGQRLAYDDSSSGFLQWVIGILVTIASALVLYSYFVRPVRSGPHFQGEAYIATPQGPSSFLNSSRGSPNVSTISDDQPFVRPFGESPVYGSPHRYRPSARTPRFS